MTIKELLDAIDDLRAVVEELPEDADVSDIYVNDMRLGCIRKELLLADGIESSAAALRVSELGSRTFAGGSKAYFRVGEVSVTQYGVQKEDEKTL